jgi:GNAT superfamily N-acetyltransferase
MAHSHLGLAHGSIIRTVTLGSAAVTYCLGCPLDTGALEGLFAASWPGYTPRDWRPVLARSLACVCAFQRRRLIGFVHVAWDGGLHAFLLDPTVHPDYRRRGIGTTLVHLAVQAARAQGAAWLHVDCEPQLVPFYCQCGFRPTTAGLMRL